MQSKLKQDKYKRYLDMFRDIDLIWENCFRYNRKDSEGFEKGRITMRHAHTLIHQFTTKHNIVDDERPESEDFVNERMERMRTPGSKKIGYPPVDLSIIKKRKRLDTPSESDSDNEHRLEILGELKTLSFEQVKSLFKDRFKKQ